MVKASSLLGWQYTLSGTVVRGEGRGRTLGFPTANIDPLHPDKIIPGDGVYAVTASVENGIKTGGMLNIGTNPTFSGTRRTIEVNMFDFNKDIYDAVVTVEFHEKIRNETAFPSREALMEQLGKDKIRALEILGGTHD